jgi:hypothetical protein
LEQVPSITTDTATKTATFNLRADYALPSTVGLDSETADLEFYLSASSDHRLVAVDVNLIDLAASCGGAMPEEAPTEAPIGIPTVDGSGSNRSVGVGFIATLILAVAVVCASV